MNFPIPPVFLSVHSYSYISIPLSATEENHLVAYVFNAIEPG